MRVAITGSTGMIGSVLTERLREAGDSVVRIVRHADAIDETDEFVKWSPREGAIEGEKLEGIDAIIHLAGENIGSGRWTVKRKSEIVKSRVEGTKLLCHTLARLCQPPKVLLSASAIGYYGNRDPGETVAEDSAVGKGFLADVCRKWEQATQPAQEAGIRVVHLRFGMVLSTRGGALGRMLPLFKVGLGGKIGRGEQDVSWIALDEIPNIVQHLLSSAQLSGPVNVVAPHPVSNAEFTRTLAQVMRRPAVFPVPSAAIKLLFGEMGEELLLNGSRVIPRKLQLSGYTFIYPELEQALQFLLRQPV